MRREIGADPANMTDGGGWAVACFGDLGLGHGGFRARRRQRNANPGRARHETCDYRRRMSVLSSAARGEPRPEAVIQTP